MAILVCRRVVPSTSTLPRIRNTSSTASPEEARLDPTNLHVLLAHLRAATFEMPFNRGDR